MAYGLMDRLLNEYTGKWRDIFSNNVEALSEIQQVLLSLDWPIQ